jgi:hypothetical protein
MERDGQLDDAETGAKMTSVYLYGRNRLLPQLVGQLRLLVLV